jgi:GNAT superfamily N-acetyltransferase
VSMGLTLDDTEWPSSGEKAVRERLGVDMMAFVVDDPRRDGRLVASAAGTIHRRLPRPGAAAFPVAYIQWVATDEEYRRQGLARDSMMGLLGWFQQNGVRAVELHATPMAESLYQAMGFGDAGPRALRIRDLGSWPGPS